MTERQTPFESNVGILNEGLRPFAYWRTRALKVLRAWRDRDPIAGYSTGFQALDDFIRLTPTEVTILGARPGMGKTALVMQIAANMLRDQAINQRIAVFSAEMSGWSLYMRLACAVSGVSTFDLRTRRASDDEFELTERAINAISDYPILVDDRSKPSTEYMRAELEVMSSSYDLRGLIFDFMELSGDSGNNQEQRLSNAMLNLKTIAKDFELPVLAISHLNREVENRADKIPQLDDMRYSGMIEQLADQVILMTRPKYYVDKGMKIDLKAYEQFVDGGAASNVEDIAYLFIAKNRNGRTGIARLGFNGAEMRFFDIRRVPLAAALDSIVTNTNGA